MKQNETVYHQDTAICTFQYWNPF